MPDHRVPPDERRIRDDHARRIELLERRLARGLRTAPIFESFSLAGPLYISDSGLYYPPRSGRLVRLTTSLDVVGSSSTVVKVWRGGPSGLLLETITLLSGQDLEPRGCNHYISDTQYLQFQITTAGAAARSLTIQTEIHPA